MSQLPRHFVWTRYEAGIPFDRLTPAEIEAVRAGVDRAYAHYGHDAVTWAAADVQFLPTGNLMVTPRVLTALWRILSTQRPTDAVWGLVRRIDRALPEEVSNELWWGPVADAHSRRLAELLQAGLIESDATGLRAAVDTEVALSRAGWETRGWSQIS